MCAARLFDSCRSGARVRALLATRRQAAQLSAATHATKRQVADWQQRVSRQIFMARIGIVALRA